MSPKESLDQSIEHFREFQNDLIENISNICNTPREKIIKMHYKEIMAQKTPWYQAHTMENMEESSFNASTMENHQEPQSHENDVIEIIEQDPDNKESFIKNFLKSLPDLEEKDMEVLSQNLKTLSLIELKKELTNLKQIFTS